MAKKIKEKKTEPKLTQSQLALAQVEKKNDQKLAEPATALMKAVASYAPSAAKMRQDFTPKEIREVNQMIAKREESEIAKEARTEEEFESRKQAVRVKRIARKLESGNNSRLIFFPSYSRKTNELLWYKAGNFSALYYTYRVADRLGRIANIKKDSDHFATMNQIVSIKNIESFVEEAMQLNDFESYEKTPDDIYILYLKKPLDKEDVWVLKRTQTHQKNLASDVVRPKNADADFYQYLLIFVRELVPRLNRLEKGYYDTYGVRLNGRIMDMMRGYTEYAEGFMKVEEFLKVAQDFVLDVRVALAVFNENDVWSADRVVMLGEMLHVFIGKILKLRADNVR